MLLRRGRVYPSPFSRAGRISYDSGHVYSALFNALTLGSLYGLIAIGYTMVYGILRLINFAHGDIFR
jgi:hypothetical protein